LRWSIQNELFAQRAFERALALVQEGKTVEFAARSVQRSKSWLEKRLRARKENYGLAGLPRQRGRRRPRPEASAISA
jgi:hypothetical protein